jgi:hypothetical protein
MRWTRRVARHGGEERCKQSFGWGSLREEDHWEDSGVDERIILRWVFRKWVGGMD